MKTVEEALKSLPQDAESIAAFFGSQGIRGKRLLVGDCPLARWLQRECGTRKLWVGPQMVVHVNDDTRELEYALLAQPVMDFMHGWDRGAYSHLVEEEQE